MALNLPTQLAIGAAVLGAVAFLVFSAPKEGVLDYVYVNAVAEAPGDFKDREFKVHGNVVEESLRQDEEGVYHFVVEYQGARLKVDYSELLPDTFVEGGEVVLTGRLSDDGSTVVSKEMSAKCPSKYEEQPGAMPKGKTS